MPADALAAKANYMTVEEMESYIAALDGFAEGRFQVLNLGSTPNGHTLRAVLIAENVPGGDDIAANADRPSLLIECGSHAREWATTEVCVSFIRSLVQLYVSDQTFGTSTLDDILEGADIWVIPVTNPDGREMDDPNDGDPEEFWRSTAWHPDTSSDSNGWRDNAQFVSCPGGPLGLGLGIDLNRAYSQGWTSGQTSCLHNQFHGEYPFQAVEAQMMRRFVNNHMISMFMSVHANGTCIGAQNGDPGVPQSFRNLFNAALPAAATELALGYSPPSCEGKGFGQLTAWMARSSDVPGGKDYGTERGAVSILLELPPDGGAYNSTSDPSAYRFSPFDDSNPFHPSDAVFFTDVTAAFFPAAVYLARQARYPWCAIDPTTGQMSSSCSPDFGLTGSKIASCRDCLGNIRFRDTGSEVIETLNPGEQLIVYRVQSFDPSSSGNTGVGTVVYSRSIGASTPYAVDLMELRTYTLDSGEGVVDDVPFTFVAGMEYMVYVYAYADGNAENNTNFYRFEVP